MKLITIGRDNSCDIVVNDSRISRVHANMIQQEGSTYIYRDVSRNGTLINGILLKGSEINVKYGDSILLAKVLALPWQKVQMLLPPPEATSLDSSSTTQYNQEVISLEKGTAWIVVGYIFALLGGLLGMLIGLKLAISTQKVNGKKTKKYTHATVINGWIIFSVAIFMFFTWLAIQAGI